MQTVFYYRDSNGNPGDTFSNLGCQLLLNKALGPHYTVAYYANQPFGLDMPLSTNDVAVVCGSPWLWNHCETSEKYQLLTRFLDLAKAKFKVAVGLGSSYVLGTPPDPLTCDLWRQFDLVLCRDRLATQLLAACGVASLTVPCPAFFAGQHLAHRYPSHTGELLVYTSFVDSVPGAVYADQQQLALFDQWQQGWLKRGWPTLAMTVPDYEALQRRGVTPTHYTTDPSRIAHCLAQYKTVYSGRVHGAIVAKALGCDSHLFPVDSRAITALHLGVQLFMAPDTPELHDVLQLRLTAETLAKLIRDATSSSS